VSTNSQIRTGGAQSAPVKSAPVNKVVEIGKIRLDVQEGLVPVIDSNGMMMMNPQTGQPVMNKTTAPIFLKISNPVQKDVPKKSTPGQPGQPNQATTQMVAIQQNGATQAPSTKYWELGIVYNFGTPENPVWGELVYTYGTGHKVWFNGISEDFKPYEGGGGKTSYRTSCRFPQNEEDCRELVASHDKLYRLFGLALCVGGINKRVGLAQLDPNNPKDAEIKPLLFQKKDDQGNPMIGKDPLKFLNLSTKGGKISAIFKHPRVDPHDGMLFKTDGRNFYKFNQKSGLLYSCDKEGHFFHIDQTTGQPIPTDVSVPLVPDYQQIDPSKLAKVEFLATPIIRVKHFYGSGTKLSLQEEIIGMIVFDTRESSADATINAIGATWADTDSGVDYADLSAKFAALTATGFKEVTKKLDSGTDGMMPPTSSGVPHEFAMNGGGMNPTGIPSMGSFLGSAPVASGYPQSVPTHGTIYSQAPTSFQ